MKDNVYRILYCSRNSVQNTAEVQLAEIRKILQASRKNNAQNGITGALLFNSGCFAQVLEGPLKQVESTFERIQRDLRHAEVTVLEAGYVLQREFPEWSMAFSGADQTESATFGEFNLDQIFENPSLAAMEIREMLSMLVVQEDEFNPAPQVEIAN